MIPSLQCCGSALVSMRIRIQIRTQHFLSMRIREAIFNFISQIAIYLSLGLHKGRPIYRRSLHSSKENKTSSKLKLVHFCGSFWPSWIRIPFVFAMRIRIHPTKMNADPDPWGRYTRRWILKRGVFLIQQQCYIMILFSQRFDDKS